MSEQIPLSKETDTAVQDVTDVVKDIEKLEGKEKVDKQQFCGENMNNITNEKINLQNTEELKLQLEEIPEQISPKSSIDVNSATSDVQAILFEVLNKVSAASMEYIGPLQNGNNVNTTKELKLPKSNEEMETECVGFPKNDFQKHGVKRPCDDADGIVMSANSDSLYVLNLVQEELDAVEKQLDTRKGVKIVDYESDSCESSSSDGESSSSHSESTTSSDSSVDERIIIDKLDCEDEKLNVGAPKTKDEILLNELPPEPLVELVLSDDVSLVHIGVIASVVESIVIVRALPNTPAVDADTLLFLENRKCLGKVFETFGPVQSPFYSVRFDSPDSITKADIKTDMKVYFAPNDLDMTKLIFTSQIEKLKGSDASWKHDQEPPDELIEYSDDEQEAVAKSKKKQARKANKQPKQGQNGEGHADFNQQTDNPQQREIRHTYKGRGRGRNQGRPPPPGIAPSPPQGASQHPWFIEPPPPQINFINPMVSPPPPPRGSLLGPHSGHLQSPVLQGMPRPFPPPHIPPPHPGQFLPPSFQSPPPPYNPYQHPPPPPAMPPGPGAPPPWPPFNFGPSR